jgi:hypothetical protein
MLEILKIIDKYLSIEQHYELCIYIPIFRIIKRQKNIIYITIKNYLNFNFYNYCSKFPYLTFDFHILTNNTNYNFNNCKNVNLTIDKLSNENNIIYCNNINNINNLSIYDSNTSEILNFTGINSITLSNIINLKILNIYNTHNLTLYRCNLNVINHNDCITNLSIHNCNINMNILKFTKLTSLCLIDCNFVNNSNLKELISHLSYLKYLSLNYCNNITDVSCLKHIKFIQLIGCNIKYGVEELSNVYSIDMSYNNFYNFNSNQNTYVKLNYTPIINFNFKNLNALELMGNNNITYEDTKNFKNIKYLNLSQTDIINIHPIDNLIELSVAECHNLKLIPLIKSLKILNVSYCTNLIKILSNNLELLNIDGCYKIDNLKDIQSKHTIHYIK